MKAETLHVGFAFRKPRPVTPWSRSSDSLTLSDQTVGLTKDMKAVRRGGAGGTLARTVGVSSASSPALPSPPHRARPLEYASCLCPGPDA